MTKLALLASFLLTLPALAQDVVVTTRKHREGMKALGQEVPGSDKTEVTWIGKDRMRVDDGESVILVRADQKKVYMIDLAAKTYSAFDLPFDPAKYVPAEMAPMLAQMRPKVAVTATGETKQIKEWSATRYTMTITSPMGSPSTQEMWVVKDLGIDLAAWREMAGAMLASNPMMGGMADELKKVEGFPVLTERTMMGSTSREEVLTIERKEAPAGHYDLPAGLTEKPFDAMGDSTMRMRAPGPGGGRGQRKG
jgi:hypothetical protein